MKSKSLFFKTTISILLALCLLASGMMMIAASDENAISIGTASLTPDVSGFVGEDELPVTDGSTPPAQTQLAGRFGEYSFLSEENGKSVVTVYSSEQIADFVARRESGEWFSLTAEDVFYLIGNTRELFETYDVIRIYDIEGNLNTYYGLSFYSSEEYYASFGVVAEESDASYNLSEDVYNAIIDRISVLCSAVGQPDEFNSTQNYVVFTDLDAAPVISDYYYSIFGEGDQGMVNALGRMVESYWFWQNNGVDKSWYWETDVLDDYDCGAFIISRKNNSLLRECAYYISNIGNLDLNDYTSVFSAHDDYYGEITSSGKYEYANNGKAVIAEVWDNETETIVARVRIDGAEDVANIESLWQGVLTYLDSPEYEEVSVSDYFYFADYTVVLYLHGIPGHFGRPTNAIHYRVDGDCDMWGFGEYDQCYQLAGSASLAAYVNAIIAEQLAN